MLTSDPEILQPEEVERATDILKQVTNTTSLTETVSVAYCIFHYTKNFFYA